PRGGREPGIRAPPALRRVHAPRPRDPVTMRVLVGRARSPQDLALGGASVLACTYLLVPIIIILPISFSSYSFLRLPPPGLSLQWYETILRDPAWVRSFLLSAQIALASMIVSVVIGSLAAIGLIRGHFPLKSWVYSLLLMPIVLPSVVVAVGILILYAEV